MSFYSSPESDFFVSGVSDQRSRQCRSGLMARERQVSSARQHC